MTGPNRLRERSHVDASMPPCSTTMPDAWSSDAGVLLQRIGRGGMGVVHAYDPELDRRIAPKIVATGDAQGSQGRAACCARRRRSRG
ncbi:MAG: hypothetical protein IPK74_36585 [Deltaproteobacteria bacterium]|nr:hypothetical protein [Deltaproteobacteria bacterium]